MAGTFGSINVALSGMRYSQVAMDVANSNVANVGTDGYVRRRAVAESVGSVTPALWSRDQNAALGVQVSGLQRMTDPFLDARSRTEHANQSYLDTRVSVLDRLESGIGEPGDAGIAASLADFRASWQNLANNPGNPASRSQVLAAANTLVDSIHLQARNLDTETAELRQRVVVDVEQVNVLAADLAATNASIANAGINGVDAGSLLDQRDRLAMALSELTGAKATQRADGGFDMHVGGVALVSGINAGTLQVASGINADGTGDGSPISFAVTLGGTTSPIVPEARIGAFSGLVDDTIATYRAGLDAVVQQLAADLNSVHEGGYDLNGNPGQALFGFDPANPSGTLSVLITDGELVAASALPGGGLDSSNADRMSTTSEVESSYQRLVAVFGTEVASAHRLATNQKALTNQVDNMREALAGVSIDEEMVNLMAAQRTFEAASRVLTTLDSVLDTLINRTGLTR